jgi:predicted ABC-type ATPase
VTTPELGQLEMVRPVLFVLAGVNGAGKSSIGGHLLRAAALPWFNADAFARELTAMSWCDQAAANARAWAEGLRRLDEAITRRRHHAFETTLGGRTMAGRIVRAAASHDVLMWFCGLDSPERHIARVRARMAAGGHDIPEARIRERYPRALANLIALMPRLSELQVYDNSVDAPIGASIPDPRLVLHLRTGRLIWPRATDAALLAGTPEWAKPVVAAALEG